MIFKDKKYFSSAPTPKWEINTSRVFKNFSAFFHKASNFSVLMGWLMTPHSTVLSVNASLTINLSLGDRPVRLPVAYQGTIGA